MEKFKILRWDPVLGRFDPIKSTLINRLLREVKKVLLLNTSAPDFTREDPRMIAYQLYSTKDNSAGLGVSTRVCYPLVEDEGGRTLLIKFKLKRGTGALGDRATILRVFQKRPVLEMPPIELAQDLIRCTDARHAYNPIRKIQCKPECEICFGQGAMAKCPRCPRGKHVCPICTQLIPKSTQKHFKSFHGIDKMWPSKLILRNYAKEKVVRVPENLAEVLDKKTAEIADAWAPQSSMPPPPARPVPRGDVQAAAEILLLMGRHDEPPLSPPLPEHGEEIDLLYVGGAKRLKPSSPGEIGDHEWQDLDVVLSM